MRTTTRALSILVIASTFALQSAAVTAQPAGPSNPKEVARELVRKGFERFNAGAYDESINLYRQADDAFHAPTILMLEADAHERKNDLLSAREVYRQVADEVLPPNSPQEFLDAQQRARQALLAIDKRIPQLRVMVRNSGRAVRVTINGFELPATSLGLTVERNPGLYALVATEEGGRTVRRNITLGEGARDNVVLEFPVNVPYQLPIEQPPTQSAPSPTVTPPPARTTGSTQPSGPVASKPPPDRERPAPFGAPPRGGDPNPMPTSAMVAFLAAALGTGAGIVTGGLWLKSDREIREQCDGDYCPKRLEGDIATTKKLGVASVISFSVAGAGLGLGLIFMKTSSNEEVGVSLSPSSITLRGTF